MHFCTVHTLEILLKGSPDLKFPRQVVIFPSRRPNLPSVKLQCRFAIHRPRSCTKCAYWQKSDEGNLELSLIANYQCFPCKLSAHLTAEGASCSSSTAGSFWIGFSNGSNIWLPCEFKMCFA